jgi:ABC-type nitrate/sulfonate/bicarbonate transport system substrate-binding protein
MIDLKTLRCLLPALALATGLGNAAAETLKVGYLPVTGHAKFFVAKEQGLFAREGLDVELIEFQNSADGLNAVVAGKLDIGAFGTTAPVAHIAKGAKIKIIGGIMGGDAALIATPANAARSPVWPISGARRSRLYAWLQGMLSCAVPSRIRASIGKPTSRFSN